MSSRAIVCALVASFAAGCGDDVVASGPDASEPLDAGNDAALVRRDAGPPIVEPSLFDCTSAGATAPATSPARVTPVPVACATDPTCRTAMVAGHRGAGGELGRIAPEDTLAAYRAAIVLGVDFVETDPRPTADGVIVNMHDTTVDRTTDGTGTVLEMTFDAVRALHIRTTFRGDYSCERVPTLEEILVQCKGRAHVLVDANKTDRVDLLVRAIQSADALDWAIFDTSDVAKIDAALAIEPGLHVMIRPSTVDEITVQLDHFAPLLPVIVELENGVVLAGAPIVHARGTRAFTDVFAADALFNVAEDSSGYETLLDQGLDIPQTDRPDAVLALFARRGLR